MSIISTQLVEVVAKLIQLTQEDKISWSTSTAKNDKERDDIRFGTIYTTKYLDKKLRLYKISQKTDQPPIFTTFFGNKPTGPFWISTVRLEFINEENQPTWTFPENKALEDLLEAASCQTAGVYNFIDEILKDSKEPHDELSG